VSTDPVVLQTQLGVLGTGIALPGVPLSSADLVRKAERYLPSGAAALALRIAKRLHIAERHLVRSFDAAMEVPRPLDSSPKISSRAVLAALEDADIGVEELRTLIGHTTTPHTLLPANIAWVAEELGFGGAHLELRQACTGFAAATMLSTGLVTSGVSPVAIVGTETGSVFLDAHHIAVDNAQLINFVQMGDGAGAAVLGAPTDAGGARIETVFYGSLSGFRKPGISLLQGGSGQPASDGTRTAHFMHDYESVRTQGLELLQEGLRVATEAGIAADSVDWWIVHPANGRMAEYASKWLKVRQERIFCEAAALGNLGSAAIWVTLDRLRRSGRLAAGDRVLVLGAEASKYMYGGFLYVHGASGL